jgi:sensor histidine kinase YesM
MDTNKSIVMTGNRFWWIRLVIYLIVWTAAYVVLIGMFASSSAGSQPVDHIYTSIFIFTLLIPVTINDWFLQPSFLYERKYTAFFLLATLNILAGALLNQLTFTTLIDYILPGYYFISYYEFVDLLKFFLAFVASNMLISLSLEWFRFQEQRYRLNLLEKEKVSAEFKALAAQVNPHFLFNSLTILYALSIKNSSETPGAILRLSEILRYVIHQSSGPAVTLRSELMILESFIGLQRYRIHPSTEVELVELITNDDVMIAPMLFLPLLENSFKHGVHEETGDAFVRAKVVEEHGLVHFTIVNNKPADSKAEKGGFGLKNLAERLRLMYPGKHSLDISETESTFAVAMQVNLK